jgi:Zn ribbon nucleic-acid-binding protein
MVDEFLSSLDDMGDARDIQKAVEAKDLDAVKQIWRKRRELKAQEATAEHTKGLLAEQARENALREDQIALEREQLAHEKAEAERRRAKELEEETTRKRIIFDAAKCPECNTVLQQTPRKCAECQSSIQWIEVSANDSDGSWTDILVLAEKLKSANRINFHKGDRKIHLPYTQEAQKPKLNSIVEKVIDCCVLKSKYSAYVYHRATAIAELNAAWRDEQINSCDCHCVACGYYYDSEFTFTPTMCSICNNAKSGIDAQIEQVVNNHPAWVPQNYTRSAIWNSDFRKKLTDPMVFIFILFATCLFFIMFFALMGEWAYFYYAIGAFGLLIVGPTWMYFRFKFGAISTEMNNTGKTENERQLQYSTQNVINAGEKSRRTLVQQSGKLISDRPLGWRPNDLSSIPSPQMELQPDEVNHVHATVAQAFEL